MPPGLPRRKMPWRGWWLALRGTYVQFSRNGLPPLAAAMSFFNILGLLPAALALVSILGLFGQGAQTIDTILQAVAEITGFRMLLELREPLVEISLASSPLPVFLASMVGALWTVSAYVLGMGSALNRIYGVEEGRPYWKLRPLMMLVALAVLVIFVLVMLSLLIGGDIAQRLGDLVGLGDLSVQLWSIGRWPVILLLAIALISLLFYATPNVRRRRVQYLSIGAVFALLCWGGLTYGFYVYVQGFSEYNTVYGSLGGVIIALLWVWMSNLALLIGAAFDAEVIRAAQLAAGMDATDQIRLVTRDESRLETQARLIGRHADLAKELRESDQR